MRLIITHIHERNLHTCREQILCLIHRFYWIALCRDLLRTVLRECLSCKRYSVKAETTYMADLPERRMLADQKLFTRTSADLIGPI